MEEIETFVRKLCSEGDLSILTKKLIRTQYQAHYNKATVTREEKDKINEVLETVIQELAAKDLPASTGVNSSSLDQGKENLHADYVCLTSTTLPTGGVPHKNVYKSTRVDLGVGNLGHNHLIQVSLNKNTCASKPPSVRFRSSSTGNNEVPRQLRSSPRKRTSSDSASSNNNMRESAHLYKASDCVDGDSVSDSKVRKLSEDRVECSAAVGASGENSSSVNDCRNKQMLDGRYTNGDHDCSSDEVRLLSMGSDSSGSGSSGKLKPKMNSPPKWKKSLISKKKAADQSLSASNGRDSSKASVRQHQQKKTRRMYSVQSVLSAIFETDESADTGLNSKALPHVSEEEENSSSSEVEDKPSRDSQVVNVGDSAKTRDSQNKRRRGQENHTTRLTQGQSARHCNGRSRSARPADIKSENVSKKDNSGSVPSAGSDNILQSGFSAEMFFTKKLKRVVPKPKVKKSRRLRIESDSDLSCDSMPSPVCKGKNVKYASSQSVQRQNNDDSDSDTLLSDVKEQLVKESTRRVVPNKRTISGSRFLSDDRRTQRVTVSSDPVFDKAYTARQNGKQTAQKAKKLEMKTGQRALKSEVVEHKPGSDDSEHDDLPLSLLQHKRKETDIDKGQICVNGSEAVTKKSRRQKTVQQKRNGKINKNKLEKDGTDSVIKRSPASLIPRVSPVIKKVVKHGQKRDHSVLQRNTKDVTLKRKAVTLLSESADDDSIGWETSSENRAFLASVDRNTPVRTDENHVFSLSDTTEEEPLGQNQTRAVHRLTLNEGTTPSHDLSVYSVSESTEEDAGDSEWQLPLRLKKRVNVKKGKRKMNGTSKDRASTNEHMPDLERTEEEVTVRRSLKLTGTCETQTPEQNGQVDCDEPWCAVLYGGEPLMFPVIQLEDIQQRKPAYPSTFGQESLSPKTGRNIFEVLETESTSSKEENTKDGDISCSSKPPRVRISFSEVNGEQSRCFVSTVVGEVSDGSQPASLDESRTVLKKQRTVKKITPQLRTTLKLRKQVSPDKKVSSEVEEWAVVSQGESDSNEGHRQRLGSTDDCPRPKRRLPKAKKRKAASSAVSSDDEDDQPLKKGPVASAERSQDSLSDDDTPVKAKKPKRKKMRVTLESSDDDDLPLKSQTDQADGDNDGSEDQSENVQARSESEGDTDPDLPLVTKRSEKKQETDSSGDEEDDKPPKPRPPSTDEEMEECQNNHDGNQQQTDEESTPLKIKASLKAPKLVIMSSDDGLSPMKMKLKSLPQDPESDLDTSSLSSDGENEARPQSAGSQGPRIKFTMKKVQPTEKAKSEKAREKRSKKVKAEGTEKGESPYLKRLRLICRKVGIFVRNDTHFAGCTSDKQKIERLKEALKKAGMKGQPSLSKVDSVNLRREAEALDTTNIIETSGRPKRQPKDMFRPASSPKKSLSPLKQQFSRIRDLISDSDSD